jgi:hypothetical protein
MEIEGLLQSQVAELARIIGSSGLAPSDFDHVNVDGSYFGSSEPVPAIFYKPAAYWFGFGRYYRSHSYSGDGKDVGFRAGLRPGSETPFETRGPLNWSEMRAAFQDWISYVQRELAAPDFWTAVAGASSEFGLGAESDESRFTPHEQNAVAEQLRSIEEQLADAARRQTESDAFVRLQFAELREELAKMKRGKWKTFFIGSLAKMAITHVVPAEVVSAVFDRMSQFFIEHLPQLPPP